MSLSSLNLNQNPTRYFDLLIFDLDGTLIDSKRDLAEAVNATLHYMGRPPLPEELIATYVGDGAPMLIRRAMGENTSEEEFARALEHFIQHYHEHCLNHTHPYPGIPETLQVLQDAGVKMIVLTNKPERISKFILEGLRLGRFFERVYGGNSFEFKKPHPIGIEKALKETNTQLERALVVGDSSVDVETARNAGVRVCGVTYGFKPETFEQAPPDYLIDQPEQLLDIVLGPSHPLAQERIQAERPDEPGQTKA